MSKIQRSKRRGQAAMEYLMTYGWAILIVLAIMAVLVLLVNPKPMPTCQGSQSLQCSYELSSIKKDGNLTLYLTNFGSVGIMVNSTTCGTNTYLYSSPYYLSAGNRVPVFFNCTDQGIDQNAVIGKDSFQGDMIMKYTTPPASDLRTQIFKVVLVYS